MIDERMEEQASLYVLGALTSEEQQTFETALAQSAELRQFVEALRVSRDAVAMSVPLVEPPLELKKKIMAQIAPAEKPNQPSPHQESFSLVKLLFPWALATCLALICGVLLWQRAGLRDQLSEQASRLQALNQMADGLSKQTNQLQQLVMLLRETNHLTNLRIVMLNSLLAGSPKTKAVSLWDNQDQRGVFVVRNLKPLPADKDYQLWVMDPHYSTPVSAGVFRVDEQGNVRIEFKAAKPISAAKKFAVTFEPKGGVATPTLSNLVLAGS